MALETFLAAVDPGHHFPVPDASPLQPIILFEERHLQSAGLRNHEDTCCHLSLLLCLHRMGFLKFLRGDFIAAEGNVFDMPALVLTKMLRALPSRRPFAVQNFLECWNGEGRLPVLQSNDDLTIVDGVLRQLPLAPAEGDIPVFTKYHASYACDYCGRIDDSCEYWNERSFFVVPTLHLTPGTPSTAEDLLDGMLQQEMRITCPNGQCRAHIRASWRAIRGSLTVLYIDRADLRGGVDNTRLLPRASTSIPHNLLGELVSVISRSGENLDRGHFVSYHQVEGRWYFNNDAHSHYRCNFHPFNRSDGIECVSLLCYLNR